MKHNDIDKSGVYKILNKINGKAYYGSAARFRQRWAVHRSWLNKNKHANRHLQAAWNQYGESNFDFIIEIICSKEECLEFEQIYLDENWDNNDRCYNILSVAGSGLGLRHTEETKFKKSKSLTGRYTGEDNSFAKLTRREVDEIRSKYKTGQYTQRQLGLEYNIAQTTTGQIINYKRWSYTDGYSGQT